MNPGKLSAVVAFAASLSAQTVQVVKVEAKILSRTVVLTGEFLPFQQVNLHARVQGFVEKVLVDRGSVVNQGDVLVTLAAPEMEAEVAEAEAKVKAAESAFSEARAKLVAAESTYKKLQQASATEGAISGNDLLVARQSAEAAQGTVLSSEATIGAAKASLEATRKVQQYLNIAAPFPGVITERFAHPGALAGLNTGPLLRLEQVSKLRLVVAVPEAHYAGIRAGTKVPFQVSAHPTKSFSGTAARIAHSVDQKTRTMSVELDVSNPAGLLAPGMYPQVNWPVRSTEPALIVPATSVVRTTERIFVIRVKNGKAEWVNVRQGARENGHIQIFGEISAGELVVKNGTDEIREGVPLKTETSKSD